jgi:predicted flap endonuclease-1-like 5' DNA nuclease
VAQVFRPARVSGTKVQRRPQTLDDLHEIYGVGAKKAADYQDGAQ